MRLSDEEWSKIVTEKLESQGWTKDFEDDKKLGFSRIKGDHHWMQDYFKETRNFVFYDGNQKVNLR